MKIRESIEKLHNTIADINHSIGVIEFRIDRIEKKPKKIESIISDEAIKEVNNLERKLAILKAKIDANIAVDKALKKDYPDYLSGCFDAAIDAINLVNGIEKIRIKNELINLTITTPFSIHQCRYVQDYTKNIKATRKILEAATRLGVSAETIIGIIDEYNEIKK